MPLIIISQIMYIWFYRTKELKIEFFFIKKNQFYGPWQALPKDRKLEEIFDQNYTFKPVIAILVNWHIWTGILASIFHKNLVKVILQKCRNLSDLQRLVELFSVRKICDRFSRPLTIWIDPPFFCTTMRKILQHKLPV